MLSEYLVDVQDCLSDDIPLELAIKRLIENDTIENGIKIVDQSEIKKMFEHDNGYDGAFSLNDKCVYIDKNLFNLKDNMYIKYVLWHEIDHALSVQIKKKYKRKGNHIIREKYKTMGLDHVGINETATEYLTLKIFKQKYNYSFHCNYQVAVEQLINTMNIVSRKSIMDCYFYQSEKFDKLIQKTFGDSDFFNYIFDILIDKEKTIVQIKLKQMPEDENSTLLLYIKEHLYNWYVSKYLPMDNIETFEKKLKFVKQFIDQHDSLHFVNEYSTYIDILCDMQDLEELGVAKQELESLIEKYGISKDKMEEFAEFNFADSIGDNEKERTEKAIKLYDKFKNLDGKKFRNICSTFFMNLYDNFFIGNPTNNRDLYDFMKIPDMGKFLKDNPQYSFDKLAISKLYYAKAINNKVLRTDFLYIVTTFDKKKHLVFKEFDDGTIFASKEISQNDFVISYKNEIIRIKLENDEIIMQDLKNASVKFQIGFSYCSKSNYEELEEIANNYSISGDRAKQAEYNEILEDMKKSLNKSNIFDIKRLYYK